MKVYSVRLLCRKGHLPHRVIGKKWLVSYAALKAFADAKTGRRQ